MSGYQDTMNRAQLVRRSGSTAAKSAGKEVAVRGAADGLSKAYKVGRAIRVGSLPTAAALASWEIAQAGKRNKENLRSKGYRENVTIGEGGYGVTKMEKPKAAQAAAQRRTGSSYDFVGNKPQAKLDRIKASTRKNDKGNWNTKKWTSSDNKRVRSQVESDAGRSNHVVNKDAVYDAAVRERKDTGRHKGRYYGPDAFKGDTAAIKKWRAAGKPSVKKWVSAEDRKNAR